MRIGFGASGGSPASGYMLQEETADGFDAVEASFHVEHDADGRHTVPMQQLAVDGLAELLGGTVLGALLSLEDGYGITVTASTNDLAQPNGAAIDDVMIRIQASTPISLGGLLPSNPTSTRRQIHLIENGGAARIRFLHTFAGSTYQFALPGELDFDLESGGVIFIQWDPHSSVWRCLQSGTSMPTVQRGTIAFTNGGANIVDATISSVDFDSAEARHLGLKADAAFFCSVRLLDDSHVRAERDNAYNSVNATVSYEVSGSLL